VVEERGGRSERVVAAIGENGGNWRWRGIGIVSVGESRRVYVVGGGPGGLAAAAELRRRGMHPVILERGERVGTSWRAGYDRLHLHTVRGLSGLPGFGIPRAAGRWAARDAVIDYLERYRAHHDLEVRANTEVERITAAWAGDGGDGGDGDDGDDGDGDDGGDDGGDRDGARWVIHTTAGERLPARSIVVATGHAHTPLVPDWPGRQSYTGQLRHAREYRNPAPYAGLDVLVVGVGNSGAEIATDLGEGGARRVWIAVRTPPQIVKRDVAGWPAHATGILVSRLPSALVDPVARLQRRLTIPDLTRYGIRQPDDGLMSRVRRVGEVPLQDVGFVGAVRSGTVTPVAAVTGLEGDKVLLADGSAISPQAVIAATGYRRGLETMVGELGVLDERGMPRVHGGTPAAPGLFFVGYTVSLRGMLRDIAADARRVAPAVARDY
jgi:putative flavoprotein involved in K+ transport